MSIFYYDALPKEGQPDAEHNRNRAVAIMYRTRDMLDSFGQYLHTAIEAMKKKRDIKAFWRKVKEQGLVQLKPLDKLYQLDKTCTIKLMNVQQGVYRIVGNCDPDVNEPIRYKTSTGKGEVRIKSTELLGHGLIDLGAYFDPAPLQFESVIWGYDSIVLQPAWTVIQPGNQLETSSGPVQVLKQEGNLYTLGTLLKPGDWLKYNGHLLRFSLEGTSVPPADAQVLLEKEGQWICKGKTVPQGSKAVKVEPYLDLETLIWEDSRKAFGGVKADHGNLVFQGEGLEKRIGQKLVNGYGLRFEVGDADKDNQNKYIIQLLEIDDEKDEELPGYNPLKAFFDDDIEIKDNQNNYYRIVWGVESEMKLLLSDKKNTGKYTQCCFPKGEILSIEPNIYQLSKQKEAVTALRDKPVAGHENLIKLFEDRERIKWPDPQPLHEDLNWEVLTDGQRQGADVQREFVKKALTTPDFAIMEGPPGSGKTTVILELICQLAKRGQRVLLCGSTHVAIDNVLERLKEKKLLEKLAILPVRIGDEHRISDSVREFQIDRLVNDSRIDQALLLEASNLVCGTTIGILQHPHLKQTRAEKESKPIVPQFDYLIIDESSKTTFQEFLVPALYARRRILVGDIRQLSPFTDRQQLVSNISQMPLKGGKQLPEAHQRACQIIFKLQELFGNRGQQGKFIFVLNQKELEFVYQELAHGREAFKNKIFAFVNDQAQLEAAPAQDLMRLITHPSRPNWLSVFAADVIFVEATVFKEYHHLLPCYATVLNYRNWEQTVHAFAAARFFPRPPSVWDRGKELKDHGQISKHFLEYFEEKNWAEEIAWRMDREHQLRMKDGYKKEGHKLMNLSKAIDDLLPKAIENRQDLQNRLNTIASVAFPSILEMLDRGLTKRRTKSESTLTQGFFPHEKKQRHVLLKYQQRMHPDISAFPREQFYQQEGALRDMNHMAERRAWNFDRYPCRSVWFDIKGKTVRNYNQDEVKVLLHELMPFLEWASGQEPPDDGRDIKNEWTVACLTFYRGQETKIREALRERLKAYGTHNETAFSSFSYQKPGPGYRVNIKLHTVDKFQGQEADMVYLSMVQTQRVGFLDSPNRLNVALTRARYQLVIIGHHEYYSGQNQSDDLSKLAHATHKLITCTK